MIRIFVLAIVVALLSPTWASDPGEPLDCSDWVFNEPGHSCTVWVPLGCAGVDGEFCVGPQVNVQVGGTSTWSGISGVPIDNEGNQYRSERVFLRDDTCGTLHRVRIKRYDGQSQQVFAYLDERCFPGGIDAITNDDFTGIHLQFDPTNGRLFVSLRNDCAGACNYSRGWTVVALDGFTTTFEILQSYDPPSGPLSFRVPYMPEGFQYADWFDTCWRLSRSAGIWRSAARVRSRVG